MEQKLLEKTKITLLFGRICSGKTSYRSDIYRIVVSDLVRGVLANYVVAPTRGELQNTMHLDDEIASAIMMVADYAMESGKCPEIIIDGIRQVSIVERMLKAYPNAELVWLEVPEDERRRRYESRGDSRDVESFDIADNKPIELECQKIFSTFKDKIKTIDNYGVN